MTATTHIIRSLAELKAALRDAAAVYVRIDVSDALTEFVEVSAKALLRALAVDAATGEERPGDTPVRAVVCEGELFVGMDRPVQGLRACNPERSRPGTVAPPAPAHPAPPVTRPAKPAVHEFDLPHAEGEPPIHIRFAAGLIRGCGVLVAKSGTTNVSYTIVELPTDWPGRSFHLAKLPGAVGDDKDNANYSVFLAATGDPVSHQCDCKGRERWGACKHTTALAELLRRGAL